MVLSTATYADSYLYQELKANKVCQLESNTMNRELDYSASCSRTSSFVKLVIFMVFYLIQEFKPMSQEADLILGLDHPPVTESRVIDVLDSDNDNLMEATYEVLSSLSIVQDMPYYRVSFFLRNGNYFRFVLAAEKRVNFLPEETISTLNKAYVGWDGGNAIGLCAYDAMLVQEAQWNYFDFIQRNPVYMAGGHAFYTNKTEILIGFRFTNLEANTVHHGWFRLTRPNALFITPFDLVASDWNPLPNEPIRAGLPPDIPLVFAVEESGLRLGWPVQVSGWILEVSEQLGPEAQWTPVPDVSATEVQIMPSEGTQFYRLRKP